MALFQVCCWKAEEKNTYIATKQLQNKSGHTAVDPNQYVDAGKDNVRSAGDLEQEGSWVHQRCDRPSKRRK